MLITLRPILALIISPTYDVEPCSSETIPAAGDCFIKGNPRESSCHHIVTMAL